MCGIFGTTNDNNAPQTIQSGLKRLEYRGYDSWGIVVKGKTQLAVEKHTGKISTSITSLDTSPLGIGHTRWATHGGVTDKNSHPHLDCTGKIAVVHNGIVDNWQPLQKEIGGHKIVSETDSEIVVHLIEEEMNKEHNFFDAFTRVFSKIKGLNALVSIHQDYSYILAAKTGSPLVVGILKNNNLIASDVSSLLPLTKDIVFIEDNQIVKVSPNSLEVFDATSLKPIPYKVTHISWTAEGASKGKFAHYMLKEIYEQPQIIKNLLESKTYEIDHLASTLKSTKNIYCVACGSAAYAALIGQYFFAKIAKKKINTVIGSEFYYHAGFLGPKDMCLALSQSGETIDTIESVNWAKKKRAKIVSFINAPGSSLERLSDQTVLLEAGPEKAVASTKAFIAKVTLFFITAHSLADNILRGKVDLKKATLSTKNLFKPGGIKNIKNLSQILSTKKNLFVLGRGIAYPAALEIALKIKEVSYIHAEGLPAGELKHGPIALIEPGTPCIVLDPNDETSSDVLSSAMEVKARGAFVVGIGVKNNPIFDYWVPIKDSGTATVIPMLIAGQLLAYYLALATGADPDMPRNLAKSVTVK